MPTRSVVTISRQRVQVVLQSDARDLPALHHSRVANRLLRAHGKEQLRTPSCLPAATLRPDAQMHLHAAHSAAPRNILPYAFSKSIPRNSGICSCVSSIACAVALDRATCVCISPAQVLVTLTSSSAASGVPHPICLGSSTSKMSFLNLRRWCELEVRAVYPPELPLRLPVLPRARLRPALSATILTIVLILTVSSHTGPLSQSPAQLGISFGPPGSLASAATSWFVSWLGPAAAAMFSCLGSVTLWVPALQCRTPNIRTLDFRLNAFSSSTPIAAKFAISSFVAAVGSAASFFCSNDLAALNPPLPIFRATSRIASSLSLWGGKTGPLPTPHLQLSELPAVPCRTPPTVPPSCPSPPSAPCAAPHAGGPSTGSLKSPSSSAAPSRCRRSINTQAMSSLSIYRHRPAATARVRASIEGRLTATSSAAACCTIASLRKQQTLPKGPASFEPSAVLGNQSLTLANLVIGFDSPGWWWDGCDAASCFCTHHNASTHSRPVVSVQSARPVR